MVTEKKTVEKWLHISLSQPVSRKVKARIWANVTFDENHEKIIKATGNGTTRGGAKKKWNGKMDAWLLYNTLRNCRNYNVLPCAPSCFLMKAWKCSRKTKLCSGTTHIFYAFILDKKLIFDLSAQILKELNVLNNFWQNSLNWEFFIFLFQIAIHFLFSYWMSTLWH